ncbi:MAG: cobalamin biosynthesis protein CobD [Nitrospirales bacterium]|nr:cobalamin biosynthesis protein CobD [Nitrospirales bacterium]
MEQLLQPHFILLLAFLLDLVMGDPRWFPHPVRIIGYGITAGEKGIRIFARSALQERIGGVILAAVIVTTTFVITSILQTFLLTLPDALALAGLILLSCTTIALKDLTHSVQRVISAVQAEDIASARQSLAMIVGRDTQDLSEEAVLRAALESLSESLSDGVIAPVFYYALGGLPLAMAYKAVNTLDSMVGYKNEKYLNLGWASARLDDIANYIPARISGLLIVCSAFVISLISRRPATAGQALSVMFRDGRNHTSPNSGVPEAAMAGAIGIQMGGPSTYGGIVVKKPSIGDARISGKEGYITASVTAMGIVRLSALLAVGMAAAVLSVRNIP